MWFLIRKVGQILTLGLLPTCCLALFIMFRTHPVIAEGPATKLAHCTYDFVAVTRMSPSSQSGKAK